MTDLALANPELKNPLSATYDGDADDRTLVSAAVQGERRALEALVQKHQSYLYSLAQRILYSHEDAADATQEVLLRIVTNLSSYRGDAEFRTWIYRIAVRQLLAFRKARVEHVVHDFECFQSYLERTPDSDEHLPPDLLLSVEEAKVGCLMAMLLCLDREHRLVFVLTQIFEASDAVCASVLQISPENVRKRLSRAREQLRAFLNGRCGLIDANGTCRCARKTRGFIAQGIVDPKHLRFTELYLERAADGVIERARGLGSLVEETYAALLRSQRVPSGPDFGTLLTNLLDDPGFRRALDMDN